MRNIVFTRIDDRLIHGQVMTAWIHETKANEIVIVDDDVARDEFLKMIMTSAVPDGISVRILNEIEAASYLVEEANTNRIIILVKNPHVIHRLIQNGVKINSLNIGGMGARKDRSKLYRNISVSDDEKQCFKELTDQGVEVFIQVIPEEKKANVNQYL